MNKLRCAVLDDYQHVALRSADWSTLRDRVDLRVLDERVTDEAALASLIGDCEIVVIMRLIELSQRRGVTVEPTVAATEKFLARIRAAMPDTVWVGCSNWYSDQQGTPILWPLPQEAHKEFFAQIAEDEFDLVPANWSERQHITVARSPP